MKLWDPCLYSFACNDDTTAGSVQFVTHVQATGDCVERPPQQAFYRFVSMYLISKMQGLALEDAYKTLVDVYSFHDEKAVSAEVPDALPVIPGVHVIPPKASKTFELE